MKCGPGLRGGGGGYQRGHRPKLSFERDAREKEPIRHTCGGRPRGSAHLVRFKGANTLNYKDRTERLKTVRENA